MLLLTYFLIAIGISFLCSILEAVILSLTPAYIQSLSKTKPKLEFVSIDSNLST